MLVVRQLSDFATANRHQIDLRGATVRGDVHISDCERDQIAFWRDLRIADAPHFQKIVDCEPPFLSERQRHGSKQTNDCDSKYTFHNYLEVFVSVVRESLAIIARSVTGL